MSGQVSNSNQRVRKASPNNVKQRPMRATIPVASLLKQSNNNFKPDSSSQSSLHSWKNRMSPEQYSSSQKTSSCYRAKSKTLSPGYGRTSSRNVMRRTASLDTIYLNGQWPRESFYVFASFLQVDKATQTDNVTTDARKPHRLVESCGNDDKYKLIRHRLQRNSKEGTGSRERMPAFLGDHSVSLPSTSSQTMNTANVLSPKANPIAIPVKPIARSHMRNSVEGLNQEIEGLVLKSTNSLGIQSCDIYENKFHLETPEGHRAPIAEMFRTTRNVNTQTPSTSDVTGSCHSSGGSLGSSPDHETGRFGTSPHINYFLAREPPDGCEKVNLKFLEKTDGAGTSADYCPLKPSATFQLKPSQGSAFYPLQPTPAETGDCSSPETVPSTDETSSPNESASMLELNQGSAFGPYSSSATDSALGRRESPAID